MGKLFNTPRRLIEEVCDGDKNQIENPTTGRQFLTIDDMMWLHEVSDDKADEE